MRVTGDRATGRPLEMQLFGQRTPRSPSASTSQPPRSSTACIAAVSDLNLSYTPPLGSPWDAVQMAVQAWVRDTRPR
jgi:hypothetical protein